jgi:DNA-binding beta-propeller fold protein YncE
MRFFFALIVASPWTWGQIPKAVEYRHLYTFGSKDGIHPPKALNRRPATVAFGKGEHPYGLAFPEGVATDTKDRIWITDSGTASVHVFDQAHGTYREIRRIADVLLQQPSGIATDGIGRMYLTDTATGGLYEIDDSGESERSLLSKHATRVLQGPTSIAVSSDRRTIFVLDPPRQSIVVFNREGEVIGTIGVPGELREPASIAVGGNKLYVLDNASHRVSVFSTAGTPLGELRWDGVSFPAAFAYDASRDRFAVANPQYMVVEVFNQAGQNLGAVGQLGDRVDQVLRIDALHLDKQGRVFVVDSRRGKVVVYAEVRE